MSASHLAPRRPAVPDLAGLEVLFVGARGTREPFDGPHGGMGPTLSRLADMLETALAGSGASLRTIGVPYPARPWRYRRNRQTGATSLAGVIASMPPHAGNRVVLAGLSQGADVLRHLIASATLPAESSPEVVAVVLLGDPGRCPSEPFQHGTVARAAGLLAASAPRIPADWQRRTWSYCLTGDEICANRRGAMALLRSGTHTHYAQDREGVLTAAARFAFAQIEQSIH